jgi:KDO2-lipid IV(A) lauroyltransferase
MVWSMRALAALPFSLAMRVGAALGWVAYFLATERRYIADVNLAYCFPELSRAERDRQNRIHFAGVGMAVVETAHGWWGSAESLRSLIGEVQGEDYLESALAGGRGAILLAGHFTHLEMGAVLLAVRRPLAAVYRPHDDPRFESHMGGGRSGRGRAVRSDDTRGIVRALRDALPLWYAPDQNHKGDFMAFAPFFGILAASNSASGRLASISKAPMLPYWQERLPGYRYRLCFGPPLEDFPTGDAEADTARVNQVIESMVRRQPGDYLWLHARFKTRPKSWPGRYPKGIRWP